MTIFLAATGGSPASSGSGGMSAVDWSTVITAGLTVAAVVIAFFAARYARAAVVPLDNIAKHMNASARLQVKIAKNLRESADLQTQSLEAALRLRRVELLTRRVNTLEQILSSIALIAWIPVSVQSPVLIEQRFNQERRNLLIALIKLPQINLPATHKIAQAGLYNDAALQLTKAGEEANKELVRAIGQLEQAEGNDSTDGAATP